MTWLTQNWIWILFGVAFVAMHMFGHGGHGGHRGHGSENDRRPDPGDAQPARTEGARSGEPPVSSSSHHH
jgi:hypothetical protein